MKNILTYILSFAIIGFFVSDATAQNLAGVTINTTLAIDDGATCKVRVGDQNGARIFRDGVASACPTKACPGGFADGALGWDEFSFKNIINTDLCLTINIQGGGCQGNFDVHSHAQLAPYVPPTAVGNWCTNNPSFLGDQGGSGTASYSFEVTGCTNFFLVQTNTFNAVNNCDYSFDIAPDPLLDLRCADDPAICVNKVVLGGTPVPTMTQWGLFLFGLIILTLGVVTIYNMSTNTVSERN